MSNTRLLYIALVSLVIVITYFYIRLNDVKLIKTKKTELSVYISALTVSLFVMSLVYYPEECYRAAVDGVDTWVNVVLPALLPFFIGAELLIGLGVIDFIGTMLEPVMRPLFKTPGNSAFVFVMSIASGYPVGVKLTCSLREKGMCTWAEGQRMLTFCSTSGPLFMIGAVAIGMFGSRLAGTIIAISHYLSAAILGIIVGFLFGGSSKGEVRSPGTRGIRGAVNAMLAKRRLDGRPFGVLWGDAVRESINTLLIVGGFIIMFSVVIQLFSLTGALQFVTGPFERLLSGISLPKTLVQPVFSGMLEITIGSRLLSQVEALPFVYVVSAASLIIGWSGFSIHAQAVSFISRTDLNPALYMLSKLFHGILCCLTSYLICRVFLSGMPQDVFLPDPGVVSRYTFFRGLVVSTGTFLALSASMIAIPAFCMLFRTVTGFYIKER
ncbi:MAG: sporulation integral membrane protein YlbJ [Clostridia bacterium]|jgi:sporulation integral membrane protein YlbJ|nr:sporulation integral membrane protein YlbJ [Clostridiales bacterium]